MALENEFLRGRRILVADDEFLIATFLKEMIEETGAVVIGPAHNYADALRLADTDPLDAALLDVNLGDKHSFPIAARLRKRNIRFAFLTGMAAHTLPEEFHGCGTLSKPVTMDTLIATLENFFRE